MPLLTFARRAPQIDSAGRAVVFHEDMFILLPPSEGKASAAQGRAPVDLGALAFPELASSRSEVLDALAEVSGRDDALSVLKAGASLAEAVAANVSVRLRPAAPAWQVYTGVLYAALDLPGMNADERACAQSTLLISSALFGVVRPHDAITDYRLSMGVTLPGLGGLAAWWRRRLAPVLNAAAAGHVILDGRSGPYAASWPLRGELAREAATLRVFREADGKRTVVSHNAKHARGLVARHVVRSLAAGHPEPRTAAEAHALIARAFEAELVPASGATPASIDIIERA
ncbi:peroxide stress protein YaaA [Micrococcales bacterium 31B]|nr:peroxide stress protein YaaA [Micrococcales bacterium 31B]